MEEENHTYKESKRVELFSSSPNIADLFLPSVEISVFGLSYYSYAKESKGENLQGLLYSIY